MFYLKVLAHLVGVCLLVMSIALLGVPPVGAAIMGMLAIAWLIGVVAACVRHWVRPATS